MWRYLHEPSVPAAISRFFLINRPARYFAVAFRWKLFVVKDAAFSFTLGFRGQSKVYYLCRTSVRGKIGV